MQHRGEIVETAIRDSGMTIAEIARRLDITRPTLYTYFSKPDLAYETVLAIGRIIHHDFSLEIKELKGFKPIAGQPTDASDKELIYAEGLKGELYWKDKYTQTLEAYAKLLQAHSDLGEEHNRVLNELNELRRKMGEN